MIANLQYLPHATASREALEACFTDLVAPLSARQAAIESARCLYCFDAPCTRACPSEIDVASFIANISSGNIDGAAHGILQQNILGASCARVCPTEVLCEQACVRNLDQGAPVRIGSLQRHALDHMSFAAHPFERAAASGQRVAVVGAGPAGLACAHRLALLGHEVVLFEARARPGGLNEYGIAKYKLPAATAQDEVAFVLGIGGITLRCGQVLGENLSLAALRAEFDAVFLGIGLGASRRLGLTGEDAPGLLDAVEYIAALRQADDLRALPLPARALVVGAGNTAIDIAVQLVRLGAQDVSIVYRRDAAAMSATAHEQQIAREHGVRMLTWAQPQQVLLDEAGRVRGLRLEKTALVDGALRGTGASFELPADAVFKAIGQTLAPLAGRVLAEAQIDLDAGKIAVDARFRTRLHDVYAGGDCIAPGQDLTVQAAQHGKLAALAIDAALRAASPAALRAAFPAASPATSPDSQAKA